MTKSDNTKINESQIAEFRETFALFDKDSNGFINRSELGDVMKTLGHDPTDQELKDMISEVDANKDGKIDFEEFLKLLPKMSGEPDSDQDLLDAFKVFDKDDDNFITHNELRLVMKQLGQKLSDQEIDEMIKEADADNDGKIDYVEFSKMMGCK